MSFLLALSLACSGDRSDIDDRAATLIEAGRPDEAVSMLRDELQARPGDPGLALVYGKALMASGQPSMAVWPLDEARRSGVHSAEAGLLLARSQQLAGNPTDAIATLEELLEREPANVAALRVKAEVDVEARRYEEARAAVDLALEQEPDDLGLLMSRMRILLMLDEGDEAGDVLKSIRGRISEIDELPDSQREALGARYCAAEAMFTHESGDAEGAKTLFAGCLEAFPTHPQVISSAVSFYDAIGDEAQATRIHRHALDVDPRDLSNRVALSMRLARRGEADQAEALLTEVAVEQPAAWTALFDLYTEVGDQAKALGALERALEAHDGRVPSEWELLHADLLVQNGMLDEAERVIDRIEADVYRSVARGRLELARGRPARALELLEEGIRVWPDGAMARYLAARAAEQLGDFERAESEYREAYRSDQTYTDAALQLAALFASRGLYADAARLASAHAQDDPDAPRGFELAVEYLAAAGNGDAAQAMLRSYLARPEHRGRATAFAARRLANGGHPERALRLIESSKIDLALEANADALEAYCESLLARRRPAKVRETLRRLAERSPERGLYQELAARVAVAEGRPDEARRLLESLIGREPERYRALLSLASLEAADGRDERALALFDRAATVKPDDTEALLLAATLSPSLAERERRLREALRRDPRNGEAAERLLGILGGRGQRDSKEGRDLAARIARFR